jgi:hypothetical protein
MFPMHFHAQPLKKYVYKHMQSKLIDASSDIKVEIGSLMKDQQCQIITLIVSH